MEMCLIEVNPISGLSSTFLPLVESRKSMASAYSIKTGQPDLPNVSGLVGSKRAFFVVDKSRLTLIFRFCDSAHYFLLGSISG